MSYHKNLFKKGFFQVATFMALLFIILIPGYGKEPILEYLFDETGTYAESTGSDNTQLLLKKKDGTAAP